MATSLVQYDVRSALLQPSRSNWISFLLQLEATPEHAIILQCFFPPIYSPNTAWHKIVFNSKQTDTSVPENSPASL